MVCRSGRPRRPCFVERGSRPAPLRRVSTEAEELQRIISASVRDMLDAYRIQAQAGPVTDKALEEIIFRAAYGFMGSHPSMIK